MPQRVTQYPTRDDLGETFAAAFWSRIDKDGPIAPHMTTPCWLWLAGVDGHGYGALQCLGRVLMAHRIAYVLHHGSITTEHALHDCDVARCCNPEHIHLGTHVQNMAEAVERRRMKPNYGAANHNAKLTAEQAAEMRRAWRAGEATQAQLALQAGMSQRTVSDIVRGVHYPESDDVGRPLKVSPLAQRLGKKRTA